MKITILGHKHCIKSNEKDEDKLIKLYKKVNNLSRECAIEQLQTYVKLMLPKHGQYFEYMNFIRNLHGHLQQMRG